MRSAIGAACALMLVLGACGQPGVQAGGPAPPPIVTDFFPNTNAIEVVVRDPLAVERAELVAPDGRVFAAESIRYVADLPPPSPTLGPSIGVGVGGGSRSGVSTGVGIGFPIFGTVSGPGTVESHAVIAVPDLAAYRAGWQDWQIRVQYGTGEGARVATVPAPPPPSSRGS